MKIGVPASGDRAARAAHSLAAHPSVDELVIVGPANSRFYEVITDPDDCDLLVVTGPDAPSRFAEAGVPMVWDGDNPAPGVKVWGASPVGLAVALARRESDPAVAAVAHPGFDAGGEERLRFPDPVGRIAVKRTGAGDQALFAGRTETSYAAAVVEGPGRRVTIVDEAAFLTGVALAAGALVAGTEPGPVWDRALDYLNAVTEMGLVMAEDAPQPA